MNNGIAWNQKANQVLIVNSVNNEVESYKINWSEEGNPLKFLEKQKTIALNGHSDNINYDEQKDVYYASVFGRGLDFLYLVHKS